MTRARSARSLGAEARFRARLAELAAELLEPTWLGDRARHRVRCAAGHEGLTSPKQVLAGGGVCRACSGTDPATAETRFRARLAELGVELLGAGYLGANKPHQVRGACGHETAARPSDIYRGTGYCRACMPLTPGAMAKRARASGNAEAAFRARVAELGGVVLDSAWLGNDKPHRVRCAAGHECAPIWSHLQQEGGGICRVCTGHDSATAETRFRARLAELGAELLESTWRGSNAPHRVRCAAGHLSAPTPGNVYAGQGPCGQCAGKAWDVFYIAADPDAGRIKFGITSGDPRRRLGDHRAAGYREIVRLFTGLPGTVAPEIERAVLGALVLAEVRPVKGREYYDASALPLVIDVADNYPIGVTLSGK